jgi:nitrogen fixation NifU-like protein
MSDLGELYQQLIVDHSRRPRNFKAIEDATAKAEGYNPLCGDRVTLYLKTEGNVIREVGFQGAGCAISTASASLLTETLKGKTLEEAESVFDSFHKLVTGVANDIGPEETRLGKLSVFKGVCDYPTRVKCATLVWHTLRSALKGERQPVSTE